MKRDKISNDKIIRALTTHCGIITAAAKMLRVDRGTLSDWIKDDIELQTALDATGEMLVDIGESALLKNVKAGKEVSVIFLLKTKGRKRGYVETLQIADKSKITDQIESASDDELRDLMAQMSERIKDTI